MVKYSVLATTYNSIRTIKGSLESVLSQIDENFEVLVVDDFSSDGTLEYLTRLSEEGKIRLVVARCNRGQGRQLALKHAKGKYVIAKVDFDCIYEPVFKRLLKLYLEKETAMGDFVLYSNVMVSSRRFLIDIGGWRPLQWGENYELYKRLIDMGRLYVYRIPVNSDHLKFRLGLLTRLRTAYVNYRDSFRMSLGFRTVAKELWIRHGLRSVLPRFLMLVLARFSSSFYEKYGTFEGVTWEGFYRDNLYNDALGFFDLHDQNKVFLPPKDSRGDAVND